MLFIILLKKLIKLFPYAQDPKKDITQTLIDNNSRENPLKNANKADMRIKTKIIISNIPKLFPL